MIAFIGYIIKTTLSNLQSFKLDLRMTCRPTIAPLIAPIRDSTHALHIKIHRDVVQKVGSMIAETIHSALHNIGVYQTLFGLCLHIKKQAMATIIP